VKPLRAADDLREAQKSFIELVQSGVFKKVFWASPGATVARRQQWMNACSLLVGVGVMCVGDSGEIGQFQHGLAYRRCSAPLSKICTRLRRFSSGLRAPNFLNTA
jgi:hypothetical protein